MTSSQPSLPTQTKLVGAAPTAQGETPRESRPEHAPTGYSQDHSQTEDQPGTGGGSRLRPSSPVQLCKSTFQLTRYGTPNVHMCFTRFLAGTRKQHVRRDRRDIPAGQECPRNSRVNGGSIGRGLIALEPVIRSMPMLPGANDLTLKRRIHAPGSTTSRMRPSRYPRDRKCALHTAGRQRTTASGTTRRPAPSKASLFFEKSRFSIPRACPPHGQRRRLRQPRPLSGLRPCFLDFP